jgi:hypothetical protein
MQCTYCEVNEIRKIVDKSQPSIRHKVPIDSSGHNYIFTYVYPIRYAPDNLCKRCHYEKTSI